MFEQREAGGAQKEFWIMAGELPAATPDGCYPRVNRTLEKMSFVADVWKICAPAYAERSKGGRSGIDPVVYLKMLMVGFFENLPSERAIASRCGYFAVKQIGQLQRCGVRAVIADPHEGRRRRDAPLEHRQTLRRAACATRSESGKALLRKRGEHLERGFAHVLDHGGLRRATVRGCENLTKRHLIAALSFNLSLLLRTMFASGTTKQWLAGPLEIIFRSMGVIDRLLEALLGKLGMYLRALVLITDSDAEGKSGQLQPARSGVNQQAVRRL